MVPGLLENPGYPGLLENLDYLGRLENPEVRRFLVNLGNLDFQLNPDFPGYRCHP